MLSETDYPVYAHSHGLPDLCTHSPSVSAEDGLGFSGSLKTDRIKRGEEGGVRVKLCMSTARPFVLLCFIRREYITGATAGE